MALSYSALKQFQTCSRQYEAVRVLKLYTSQETEATIWGKEVHKQAEEFVRDGKEFDVDFPGQDIVRALAGLSGEKHCELELAVNGLLEPVSFDDPNAIIRGIADLVIVKDDECRVCDYKAGSDKYPDTAQLELMALLVFAKFPKVQKSHGALLFLKTGTIVQKITKREDSTRIWSEWFGRIQQIETAHETGVWNAKHSGLCRQYCPVLSCEHNGRRS
jgi:hypothetical protein